MTGYWPIPFLRLNRDEVDINNENRNKNEANILDSHLGRKSWVNKEFTIWPKRELFLAGPMREISSGEDGPILSPRVANQYTGLATCKLLAFISNERNHRFFQVLLS